MSGSVTGWSAQRHGNFDDIPGLELKVLIRAQVLRPLRAASDNRYRGLVAEPLGQLGPGERGVLKLLTRTLQLEADLAECDSRVLQLPEQIASALTIESCDLAGKIIPLSRRLHQLRGGLQFSGR
jgi:hypothetical protein